MALPGEPGRADDGEVAGRADVPAGVDRPPAPAQLLAWGLVSEREDGTYAPGPQAVCLHLGCERRNELLHDPIEPGFLLGAVLVIVGISLVSGHGWLLTLLQRPRKPVPGAVNR